MSQPSGTTPYVDDYPKTGDADEYWWSEAEGCLHGVPWDEDCFECELDEERFCD